MTCPRCHVRLQGESSPIVQYPHRAIPAMHYRCDECDSEWAWTKGVSGLRMIDGANQELELRSA